MNSKREIHDKLNKCLGILLDIPDEMFYYYGIDDAFFYLDKSMSGIYNDIKKSKTKRKMK